MSSFAKLCSVSGSRTLYTPAGQGRLLVVGGGGGGVRVLLRPATLMLAAEEVPPLRGLGSCCGAGLVGNQQQWVSPMDADPCPPSRAIFICTPVPHLNWSPVLLVTGILSVQFASSNLPRLQQIAANVVLLVCVYTYAFTRACVTPTPVFLPGPPSVPGTAFRSVCLCLRSCQVHAVRHTFVQNVQCSRAGPLAFGVLGLVVLHVCLR